MPTETPAGMPGAWTLTGSLDTARYLHTATLLADGRVLVTGGWGWGGLLASAEVYNPAAGQWTPTDSLNTGRFWHTATLLADGRVLVTGWNPTDSGGCSVQRRAVRSGHWIVDTH